MQLMRIDDETAASTAAASAVEAAVIGTTVAAVPTEMKAVTAGDGVDDYQRQLLRLLNQLHRENMELRAQLRTDPLTGLYSRRAFFDELEREWEHWLRYRHTASLILVDVNAFKTINDTHGHQTGDDVLIAIARQLLQQMRASDWIARLGGDEFAILVRDTSAIEAQQLADKLRDAQFVFTGGSERVQPPIALQCAVGVATLDGGIKSIRQWLETADMQMYRNKRSVYLRSASNDSATEVAREQRRLKSNS